MDDIPSEIQDSKRTDLLKKMLDWELSLDSRNIISHAWYHGRLSRQGAEEIVSKQGDFLLRHCASQPDNFVLTCKTKLSVLHFVVNKKFLNPKTVYEKIQYRFEDDAYDTLADLITFYVGSGKPITAASGVRIQFPCNRKHPISSCGIYTLDSQSIHANSNGQQLSHFPTTHINGERNDDILNGCHANNNRSFADGKSVTTASAQEIRDRNVFEHLHSTNEIQAWLMNQTHQDHLQWNNKQQACLSQCYNSVCDGNYQGKHFYIKDFLPITPFEAQTENERRESEIKTAMSNEHRVVERAPVNRLCDSLQSVMNYKAFELSKNRGVFLKNPKFLKSYPSMDSLNVFDNVSVEDQLHKMQNPNLTFASNFNIPNFSTVLLPSLANSPLDIDALNTLKVMILDTGSKIIAEHITRTDIDLIFKKITLSADDNTAISYVGIELITLPQGHLLRKDLIERTQCLRFLVAVTILTCGSEQETAEMIDKWIQVAVDIKTALGNLFGFFAIMLGLCMPQVQRLENIWHTLRQKFTDSAFLFEAKLKPTLINMNNCSNPLAPNTTVPHLLIYILLKDHHLEHIFSPESGNHIAQSCITPIAANSDDFGLSIHFLHLESARSLLKNIDIFTKNANTVINDADSRFDELLVDAFRTEFHVKFLWGSNGISDLPEIRYSEMEKNLRLLSEKHSSL